MSKGLGKWKNTLKPAQIADGMNAANDNARRLAEDAEIVFNLNRLPSAFCLLPSAFCIVPINLINRRVW